MKDLEFIYVGSAGHSGCWGLFSIAAMGFLSLVAAALHSPDCQNYEYSEPRVTMPLVVLFKCEHVSCN